MVTAVSGSMPCVYRSLTQYGWKLSGGVTQVCTYSATGRHFSSATAPGSPRILCSGVGDILMRFAVEEYLMQTATVTGPLMYLWRPAPVVTIGRHQNPWKECVLANMDREGVSLIRRKSGGGAVFMDPGNSVFTFISPSDQFSIDKNFDIVVGALKRCGINADRSGRNDLTVDGKKISGSAFKHSPDRGVSLHHGTILVDTDMQALQKYLTPDKRKLQAKGISSVGARVLNLKDQFPDFTDDSLRQAFIDEFCAAHGVSASKTPIEMVDDSPILSKPEVLGFHAEMADKEWRFGRTPEFTHQLDTRIDGVGVFDVRMDVVSGKIVETVVFSDALYPAVIDEIMLTLKNVEYGRGGIDAALKTLAPKFTEDGPAMLLKSFNDWLCANVDD